MGQLFVDIGNLFSNAIGCLIILIVFGAAAFLVYAFSVSVFGAFFGAIIAVIVVGHYLFDS